jgi:hypothetical protein
MNYTNATLKRMVEYPVFVDSESQVTNTILARLFCGKKIGGVPITLCFDETDSMSKMGIEGTRQDASVSIAYKKASNWGNINKTRVL